MIDLKLVSTSIDILKQELPKKGYDASKIDELAQLVQQSKRIRQGLEELRTVRNKNQGDPSIPNDAKRELREQITEQQAKLGELEKKINDIMLFVPNIPDKNAPIGKDSSGNVVITESVDHKTPDVQKPLSHWEVAEALGILDLNASSKMSGAMFSMYLGEGARLLRALVNYGLSLHNKKYLEIMPSHLVSGRTLTFTGHLPKFSEEQYKTSRDDLWLIPTAEAPLTAYFAERTLSEDELPQRCMAYTVCFRREAGSYGKDTRGLQRLHEFHKVELLKIVEPSRCDEELQDLLQDCLKIIKALKLQYRVVDLCTGDMGDKYARCFDIEVFAPGIRKWLEVASVGHFSDYQARRANIKYRAADGSKKFAFTMNGSGIATPRVWASIIELYQQEDGSVLVPDVLTSFMDDCTIIKKGE